MALLTTREACKQLGVCANTLRAWDKQNKIKVVRTPGGMRLYDISAFTQNTNRSKVIYARVSSQGQKNDLTKQVEFLRTRYPEHELIQDIGSGLNFKRKGFTALLERILSGDIEEIVVAHKDRLCRFGFDLFQFVASKFDTRIVVLEEPRQSPQQELVQDLLSIIHVFSCRLYGLRKYSNKIKEDKDLPRSEQLTESQ